MPYFHVGLVVGDSSGKLDNGSAQTRSINIDVLPQDRPIIQTEDGPMPASVEGMLAHEAGHAVTGVTDEVVNTQQNEVPVERGLGLPARTTYP